MCPIFRSRILMMLLSVSLFGPAAWAESAKATFAGGCFWCVEAAFDSVEGVSDTVSGYANGHLENPSYSQVSAGGTGHYEAVQVTYDTTQVAYEDLLEVYWANVDPLDDGGQFCDRGASYKTAIFYHTQEQQELAVASRQRLSERYELASEVVTPIEPIEAFYPAEPYHQNYHQENSLRYNFYVWKCGRHDRLEVLWGDQEGKRLTLF